MLSTKSQWLMETPMRPLSGNLAILSINKRSVDTSYIHKTNSSPKSIKPFSPCLAWQHPLSIHIRAEHRRAGTQEGGPKVLQSPKRPMLPRW